MMNRFEGPGAKEARIRYLDGDFQVTSPGAFVRCAVTGEQISARRIALLERGATGTLPQCDRSSLKREIETDPALRREARACPPFLADPLG